MESYPYPVKKG